MADFLELDALFFTSVWSQASPLEMGRGGLGISGCGITSMPVLLQESSVERVL